jgi:hypothetical protein
VGNRRTGLKGAKLQGKKARRPITRRRCLARKSYHEEDKGGGSQEKKHEDMSHVRGGPFTKSQTAHARTSDNEILLNKYINM